MGAPAVAVQGLAGFCFHALLTGEDAGEGDSGPGMWKTIFIKGGERPNDGTVQG